MGSAHRGLAGHFGQADIMPWRSARAKSDLYIGLLPLINSGTIELSISRYSSRSWLAWNDAQLGAGDSLVLALRAGHACTHPL